MALLVGTKAPNFKGIAVVGGDSADLGHDTAYAEISLEDYKGKWLLLFFYPNDFSFICPTEIEGFGKVYDEFQKLNCEVIACSTDSRYSHFAWRRQHDLLKSLPYPMLSDITREIAQMYDVYNPERGVAERGLFLIHPDGIINYQLVHPDGVGRNPEEALRVLEALQSGEMTPCGWKKGEPPVKKM
ncbi:MAG: peroxiredoxin [Chloroflexota bacterium]